MSSDRKTLLFHGIVFAVLGAGVLFGVATNSLKLWYSPGQGFDRIEYPNLLARAGGGIVGFIYAFEGVRMLIKFIRNPQRNAGEK